MPDASQCPECGAPLPPNWPKGLCAHCALKGALELSDENSETRSVTVAEAGDRIGRYKLLEKIGEGGCGVVYMAEQEEPVRRRVALKIIKPGMDTREVIARFEAERQALALMEHPHIAKVFDGGTTEAGRPYFVMELVRGPRITDYCDQKKLSTRQRLDLFMQVCQAVQHAHQKGIIHRDLKPSNILVTVNDGVPVPKVIDFGIAKATGRALTDKTFFTKFQQLIGTPAYMSPEQAEMTSVDIDTRSDIYSLGVLLYELLTGRTPFDSKELLRAGMEAMLRTIREQEPVRPSARLSTLAANEQTTVAQQRQTDAPKLINLVRGDLDWIVMKCLEKDRARRYETANGLALDLQRHLDQEPVFARPPSTTYRAQKFVRRNKGLVTATAAIAFVLVLGVVISAWQWRRAEQARVGEAEQRKEADARAAAESEAKNHADQQRGRAEEFLGHLMLQKAEDLFAVGNSSMALVWLARLLRDQPSNSIASKRLLSALTWRSFPLCTMALADTNSILQVSFGKDRRKLVTVQHRSPRIWDIATGQPLTPPFLHITNVTCAALSPDGSVLATCSDHTNVCIWEVPTGKFMGELLSYENIAGSKRTWGVGSLEFSPDGHRLLMLTGEAVHSWEIPTGRKLAAIRRDPLQMVASSPDRERIVTVSSRHEARIWNARTGEPIAGPFYHYDLYGPLAFSPDGQLMLVANTNNLQCLDLGTGQPVGVSWPRITVGLGARFHQFVHGGRWVWAEIEKDTWAFLDFRSGEVQGNRFRTRSANVAISPDESKFATFSNDGIRLFDVRTGQEMPVAGTAQMDLRSLRFSPDGQKLAAVDSAHTVRVFEIATGRTVCEPITSDDQVEVQWAADSWQLVRFSRPYPGLFTKSVDVFDIRPGGAAPDSLSLERFSETICFSPDDARFVTRSDRTVQVWNTHTLQAITPPLEHASRVESARFTPNARIILTATGDSLCAWDVDANGQSMHPPIMQPRGYNLAVGRLPPFDGTGAFQDGDGTSAYSPDGSRVLVFESKSPKGIWSMDYSNATLRTVPGGKVLAEFKQPGQRVQLAQFSPDGERFGILFGRDVLQMWDAREGRRINSPTYRPRVRELESFQFSPDGKFLALIGTAQSGKSINSLNTYASIYDSSSGRELVPLAQDDVEIRADDAAFARFSPDGNRIAVVSGGMARIWNAHSGQIISGVIKQERSIHAVRFTANSRRLLTESVQGDDRGLVGLWDASSGRPIGEAFEHRGMRSGVTAGVTSDGAWIATKVTSNTVRVWDAMSHQAVSEPLRANGRIRGLHFISDARRLVASTSEGVESWDLSFNGKIDTTALAGLAEAMAGKRLTQQRSLDVVPASRLLELKEQIHARQEDDRFLSWVRWFLADRGSRTISPSSTMTILKYVKGRIEENTLESLLEAIRFSPTNGFAFARLARQTLAQNPKVSSRRIGEADSYSRRAVELSPNDPEVQKIRAEIVEQIKNAKEP